MHGAVVSTFHVLAGASTSVYCVAAGGPSGPGVEDEPIIREMGSGQAVATEILEARKKASKSAGRYSDREIARSFINPCRVTPSQLASALDEV